MAEPTPVTAGPCNTRIDRYLIERFLGGGGMGAVYRARHVMLDQLMALKLLKAGLGGNKEILERFAREARAAAAIGNPHIVRVSDFGIAPDGRAFLAMELLDGRDVEQALRKEGPMAPGRAVGLIIQALDGLGAAHAAGIVHRDLKPGNMFLLSTPGGELVKLVDFGVSKMGLGAHLPSLTQTGGVVGTPLYMAPEQFRGARDVDFRADLYAVGVTLYEMLAACPPWEGPTYEALILAIYSDAPRPLRSVAPAVPAELEQVVARAMAREPAARFGSAAEMAQALSAAADAARLVVPPAPVHVSAAYPAQTPPPGAVPPSFGGASMAAPRYAGYPGAAPSTGAGRADPPPVAPTGPGLAAGLTPASRPAAGPPSVGPPSVGPPRRKSRGPLWAFLLLALAGGGIGIAVVVGTQGGGGAGVLPAAGSDAGIPASLAPTPARKPAPAPTPAPTPVPTDAGKPPAVDAGPSSPADGGRASLDAPPRPAASAAPRSPSSPDAPPAPQAPTPPAPPAPARPAPSVSFGEPRVVGDVDVAPLDSAVEKARPQLEKCRILPHPETVLVQFHIAFGKIGLAAPAPDNQGDRGVADCIANRIRGVHPAWPEDQSGIMFVEVTVASRP